MTNDEQYQSFFNRNKLNLNDYISFRRKLHKYPEISLKEYKTKILILEKVKDISDKLKKQVLIKECKETGFYIDLTGKNMKVSNKPILKIAFRAELDALPLEEISGKIWSSNIKGFSHSCGHDGHLTVLIALLEILLLNEEKLPCNFGVRLIFQPAEETFDGAKLMLEQGVLNDINEIYSFHNHHETLGMILLTDGVLLSRADFFSIKIKWVSNINACCYIINMINSIINEIDCKEIFCLSIAKFIFEENLICEIGGSIRSVKDAISDHLCSRISHIVKNICKIYDLEYNIEFKTCPKLVNDKNLSDFVEKICQKYNFTYLNVKFATPIMGSDDFSLYSEKVPGLYYGIGGRDEEYQDINPHSGEFDFNDKIIPFALELFLRIVEEKSDTKILN